MKGVHTKKGVLVTKTTKAAKNVVGTVTRDGYIRGGTAHGIGKKQKAFG